MSNDRWFHRHYLPILNYQYLNWESYKLAVYSWEINILIIFSYSICRTLILSFPKNCPLKYLLGSWNNTTPHKSTPLLSKNPKIIRFALHVILKHKRLFQKIKIIIKEKEHSRDQFLGTGTVQGFSKIRARDLKAHHRNLEVKREVWV